MIGSLIHTSPHEYKCINWFYFYINQLIVGQFMLITKFTIYMSTCDWISSSPDGLSIIPTWLISLFMSHKPILLLDSINTWTIHVNYKVHNRYVYMWLDIQFSRWIKYPTNLIHKLLSYTLNQVLWQIGIHFESSLPYKGINPCAGSLQLEQWE